MTLPQFSECRATCPVVRARTMMLPRFSECRATCPVSQLPPSDTDGCVRSDAAPNAPITPSSGVFTGALTTGRAEPVRAAIPSFWDGYQIGGYGGDYAAGLDVGKSAVYSVGAMPGKASVVARKFAHRGTPHVIAVDFTFNNSASTMPIASNISLPASWGSAAAVISTKGTVWAHDPASAAPGMACWTGNVMESEDPSLPLINLALCCTDLRTAPLDVSVPAGQTKTYSVVGVLYSTLDHASPVTLAAKGFAAAAGLTTESRWASHVAAVDSVLGSGIEIRGNHDLAKLVNASLHMLVASLRPEPEYWYSSSPGGLATNCYNGHTFWDMEYGGHFRHWVGLGLCVPS